MLKKQAVWVGDPRCLSPWSPLRCVAVASMFPLHFRAVIAQGFVGVPGSRKKQTHEDDFPAQPWDRATQPARPYPQWSRSCSWCPWGWSGATSWHGWVTRNHAQSELHTLTRWVGQWTRKRQQIWYAYFFDFCKLIDLADTIVLRTDKFGSTRSAINGLRDVKEKCYWSLVVKLRRHL